MAKRFNVYRNFSNFLSERNLVADELAVVNTAANDFPKGALFCKGLLMSKPQIPFAGIIENNFQHKPTKTNIISKNNLYFLRYANCFAIGDVTYATTNTDKLEFKLHGEYVFYKDLPPNAADYGLKYVKERTSDNYILIPNEDFEYYIYDRPALTYRVVGNPSNYFCDLHTDYNLKPGDYLLKDGTILPLKYYNDNFKSMILGVVVNPEYRSFLPFPIFTYNGKYIQTESFDQTIINDLARNSINEHNGGNIFTSITRYMDIDGIMSVSRFAATFPSIFRGYKQSLCKMYIPTVFEYIEMINNSDFLSALLNLDTSIISVIMSEVSFSTFANLEIANDNKDYINIIKGGNSFSRSLINDMSDFFFLGHY